MNDAKERLVIVGWIEHYTCGCISGVVRRKQDLVGYCEDHGGSRRMCYPEVVRRLIRKTNNE
jgi:hypothetical protein